VSVEQTLYDTLRNDATVAGLVSTRIFPQVAPDNAATPYIVYQVIGNDPHNTLAGAPNSEQKTVQVGCISNTYSEAKDIAVACKAAINGANGYCTFEGDDYFAQTENHRVMLDFSLIG
jgi:hypothetical protein